MNKAQASLAIKKLIKWNDKSVLEQLKKEGWLIPFAKCIGENYIHDPGEGCFRCDRRMCGLWWAIKQKLKRSTQK